MTGKRFRRGKGLFIDYPSEAIIDETTGERYYDGIKPNYVSSKEICELLNEQDEIISKLKTDLKYETRINNGKRFEASDRIIIDNQTTLHYICTLDWEVSLIVRLLNNLHEENNELKEKYNEQSVEYERLEEQIERLLDFRDNVFNLINKKLKEADKGFKMTYDSWYQGQVDALKELKKELIKGKSK